MPTDQPKNKSNILQETLKSLFFTGVGILTALVIHAKVNPVPVQAIALQTPPTLERTTQSIVTTDTKGGPTITQVENKCQTKLSEIRDVVNSAEKPIIARSIEEAIQSAGLKPQSTQNETQAPEAQKPVEIVKIIPTYIEGGKTFLNLQKYENDLRKILTFYGVKVPTSGLSPANIVLLRNVNILFSEKKDGKTTHYISDSIRIELLEKIKQKANPA